MSGASDEMLAILEHPTGSLHPHERQFRESWTTRWFKLTGVHPQLKEGKRATTSMQSRASKRPRLQPCKTNPHPTKAQYASLRNRNIPRAMIPDPQDIQTAIGSCSDG